MSMCKCDGCKAIINTDNDPDATDFIENEFYCYWCRKAIEEEHAENISSDRNQHCTYYGQP